MNNIYDLLGGMSNISGNLCIKSESTDSSDNVNLNIRGEIDMVLYIIIAIIVIIIWLISLSFADKIGSFFVNNIINKIKDIFK